MARCQWIPGRADGRVSGGRGVALALLVSAAAVAQGGVSSEEARFFEAKVRPALASHCISCHGPSRQAGGLRLDSREAILEGGASGPAAVEKKPAESPLIRAARGTGEVHEEALENPPEKKDRQALERWVRIGLPWPAADKAGKSGGEADAEHHSHWAFQPVERPALPEVEHTEWVRSPVDRFILAKLEAKGIEPGRRADARTLFRRVTFDLVGLPPTPKDLDAFLADRRPGAFARVVDRLLASPHYGERWGRHWLDVARYANTKGAVFQEEARFGFAYTYRDYVVDAFNADLPYDRFIKEQLAADKLDLGKGNAELAAMGFLTVGRRFLNNRHEIIDDRIDVTTRGLMGLTVMCARCHDHKYDPVPIEDYYSLYGVFASSREPEMYPLLGEPRQTQGYKKFQKELEERKKKRRDYLEKTRKNILGEVRKKADLYLVRAAEKITGAETLEEKTVSGLREGMVRRWVRYLKGVEPTHPVFGLWARFADLDKEQFAKGAKRLLGRLGEIEQKMDGRYNRLVKKALQADPPTSLVDVARTYGDLLVGAQKRWKKTQKKKAEAKELPDPAREALRQALRANGAPTQFDLETARKLFKRSERRKAEKLQKKIDKWKVVSPNAPPRAMVLRDRKEPRTPHVFKRGNPNRKGKKVPRRFPRVLAGPDRKPFAEDASGRLDLAEAIVRRDNPLTARVLVNRVWMHHFGEPLVKGPSDFGVRSPNPSHPKLLDYLASYFMDHGWSIKALHRLILRSSTYQQTSRFREKAYRKDPENRLLWQMNRQRLELEPLRDAMLAVAGRLDRRIGGRPVKIHKKPYPRRRSVYAFIPRAGYDRKLPTLFRIFDLASPDQTVPRRPHTTVPQQGLFLMNWPFVIEQAKAFASRPDVRNAGGPADRARRMYRLAYGRPPDASEVDWALAFVEEAKGEDRDEGAPGPWAQLAHALLMTNEFMYVD